MGRLYEQPRRRRRDPNLPLFVARADLAALPYSLALPLAAHRITRRSSRDPLPVRPAHLGADDGLETLAVDHAHEQRRRRRWERRAMVELGHVRAIRSSVRVRGRRRGLARGARLRARRLGVRRHRGSRGVIAAVLHHEHEQQRQDGERHERESSNHDAFHSFSRCEQRPRLSPRESASKATRESVLRSAAPSPGAHRSTRSRVTTPEVSAPTLDLEASTQRTRSTLDAAHTCVWRTAVSTTLAVAWAMTCALARRRDFYRGRGASLRTRERRAFEPSPSFLTPDVPARSAHKLVLEQARGAHSYSARSDRKNDSKSGATPYSCGMTSYFANTACRSQ